MTQIDEKEELEIQKLKAEVTKLVLETKIIPIDVLVKFIVGGTALLTAGKFLL